MPQSQGNAPNGLLVFVAGVVVLSALIFLIWGVPAIVAWGRGRRWSFPTQARAASPIFRQPVAQAPATKPQQQTAPRVLRPAEWLAIVNDRPDEAPHLFVRGGTGSGKTTFATAILAARTGQVVIITPKVDDTWGGVPFVTIDDDGTFRTIDATFRALNDDVRRRLVAAKQRANSEAGLTIVLDDYPVLASECKDSGPALFKLVARLGRSLRVRLIVLSHSDRVKSNGLAGEGDTLDNFVSIEIDQQHRATLVWGGEPCQLDTGVVPDLTRRPILSARWWHAPLAEPCRRALVPAGDVDDIFGPVPPISQAEIEPEISRGVETGFPALESDFTVSEEPFSAEEIARITALIIAGNGKTETVQGMPRYSGRKHKAYAEFYERLRAALPVEQG